MQDLGRKGCLIQSSNAGLGQEEQPDPVLCWEGEFQQFLWNKQEIKEGLEVAASRSPDLLQEWLHLIERKVQRLFPSHPLISVQFCQRNRKAELGFEFLQSSAQLALPNNFYKLVDGKEKKKTQTCLFVSQDNVIVPGSR